MRKGKFPDKVCQLSPSQRNLVADICSKFAISEQMKKNLLPLIYLTREIQEIAQSIYETVKMLEDEENKEIAAKIVEGFKEIKKKN